MGVAHYSKRQLKTVGLAIWRALIETASKWLRSLAAAYKFEQRYAGYSHR